MKENNFNLTNNFTENELDKIKEIKSGKKNINIKKSIIKRNEIHNDFGQHLTYNKKLLYELDSLPKEINQLFRKSLDKYKFKEEVYVPNSMRISKKEYYNKNYMLINLVKTHYIIQGEKNKVMNISKETKKFSNQYKLVKNDNKNRQKEYLLYLENEYKKKYNNKKNELNYRYDENIFTPSFLLDLNFGNNIELDAIKYRLNNDSYLTESKHDRNMINKFYDVINRDDKNEDNKNNKGLKKLDTNINKEDEKLIKIKNELKEQIKIKNMTKKEYFDYSNKLKKEIKKIKSLIEDNEYQLSNEPAYNNTKNSDFNFISTMKGKNTFNNAYESPEKDNKEIKSKNSKIKNNLLFELDNSKEKKRKDEKTSISYIKKNNSNNKKNSNLIKKIPKLALTEIIPKYLNEKKKNKKEMKEYHLNKLYNALSARTNSNNIDIPFKQLNSYFTKYNPNMKLPKLNNLKGSNIHGLVESLQNNAKDNSISNISKLSENIKQEINVFKKGNDFEDKNENIKTENIIIQNNKILELQYDFVDSLLSNKRDFISKSK